MEAKISIMQPFFNNPNRGYYIREIAKITKINHTTVRKYLQRLVKEDYLFVRKTTLYPLYKAKTESSKYKNIKLYYNLEKLRETKIIEKLEKVYGYPTIVLFGSFARAEDDEKSDIDLCIISSSKGKITLDEYKEKLGRPINIHYFNKKSLEHTKKKNPELINSICNGIVLSGQLEVV